MGEQSQNRHLNKFNTGSAAGDETKKQERKALTAATRQQPNTGNSSGNAVCVCYVQVAYITRTEGSMVTNTLYTVGHNNVQLYLRL